MLGREIARAIRKISKRRHKAVIEIARLHRYPALNAKDITKWLKYVDDLDSEIDELMQKLK